MKVHWIYLAVSCMAVSRCSGEEILQPSNITLDGQVDSNLIFNSLTLKDNWSLISCPLGYGKEGIYQITLAGLDPFPVLCNAQIAGAGYIVVASRSDVNLNFYRNWTEYKHGFGDHSGDFFIGLDKLHAITKSQTYELYIHLEDFDGNTRFARYDEFYIENENALYKLSKLGTYTGDAGNAFHTKDQAFSTYDQDNDASETRHCATERRGAWWYEVCTRSNLFGTYYVGAYTNQWADTGLTWELWRGRYYSYKAMKMLIRPKYICL